jgi:two-component system chemotaxis response regulator CheB
VVRALLTRLLQTDPQLRVIGTAASGAEAVALAGSLRPDVITMDILMPGMDGFAASRRIMETVPTPIVIVTGTADVAEVRTAFAAVEAGALAVLEKPPGPEDPDFNRAAAELIRTVRAMAGVLVIHRRPRRPAAPEPAPELSETPIGAVGIGASTGGPAALRELLAALPEDAPVPILIVQHIASGFLDGFAEWLSRSSGHTVRIASDGERLAPGMIRLAPDDRHLELDRDCRLRLSPAPPENGVRPAASVLLRSLRAVLGSRAAGVLLSGMGTDGVEELARLREAGGLTIVQDPESALVNGMPGAAVRAGATDRVLSPAAIGALLGRLTSNGNDMYESG